MLYTSMLPVPRNSIKHYRHRLGAAVEQNPLQMGAAPDLRFYDLWAELFAERKAQFHAAGIPEVGIWVGQTLGHGGGFAGAVTSSGLGLPFQPAQNAQGEAEPGVFCPLCPLLNAYLAEAVARLARAKPAMIMFDDDFRLFGHGKILGGCYCQLHQAEFRRRGISETRMSEVALQITMGEASPLRAAWWTAQDAAMVAMAKALGNAIHDVDPAIRVGLCAVRSALDDSDLPGILRGMAGSTKPFVRTHGAPYGDRSPHLGNGIEHIRLQRAMLQAAIPEADDLCEGDTFPHLTTRCSATMLDAYIQTLLASGATQVLTYALSYMSPLRFETGYSDLLARNQARYDAIQRMIPADCHDLGLSIPWRPGPVRSMRLERGDFNWILNDPHPLKLCPQLGIPVAHGAGHGPVLLVGWQAQLASDSELAAWAERGLILDAPAALELHRRGITCGVTAATPALAPNSEHFHLHPLNGTYSDGAVALWSCAERFYHRCVLLPGAHSITEFRSADNNVWGPGVTLYENQAGHRFVILPWDMRSGQAQTEPQLMVSHARRWQMHRLLAWVGRQPLAATVDTPHAHVMVRQLPDHSRTVVTVLNGSLDPLTPVLRLNPKLGRPATVSFLGPDGGVKDIEAVWGVDGDALTLTLPCRLPALGFCAVSIGAELA